MNSKLIPPTKIGQKVPGIDFNLKAAPAPILGMSQQPQSYVVPPPIAITQPRKDGTT